MRNYDSPERAQAGVENGLADLIQRGVTFNIIVVEQRKGGPGADAEDRRYIPLLCCWRCSSQAGALNETQAAIFAAQRGFQVFA